MNTSAAKPASKSLQKIAQRVALAAALIALAFSVLLALESAGSASLPGCSDSSKGCLSVLQSPWSKLLGMPVATLSVLFYAGVTILLLMNPIPFQAAEQTDGSNDEAKHAAPENTSKNGLLHITLAVSAACAALYFTAIQAFVLKTFCPYCCAAHAAGLIMATSVLIHHRHKLSKHKPAIATGAIAIALLAAVQINYPTEPTGAAPAQHLSFADTGPGPDRQLTLPSARPGAGVRINPHKLPIHGNANAPVVALLAHDYTCGLCSITHLAMNAAIKHFEGQLAVAVVPVARSTQEAQTLRDLALAVYLAAPSQFPAFDDYLFSLEPGTAVEPEAARAYAQTLVEPGLLQETLGSEALKDFAERLSKLHEIAGDSYPLLIIENSVWAGTPIVMEEQIPVFLELLSEATSLKEKNQDAETGMQIEPVENTESMSSAP